MLYNKKLNITENDLFNENNVLKLIEWKTSIGNEIIEIKKRLLIITEDAEIIKALDAKHYLNIFVNIIDLRIKILRKENNKEIRLMQKFMKVAKKELEKAVYNEILEKAKELSKYNK